MAPSRSIHAKISLAQSNNESRDQYRQLDVELLAYLATVMVQRATANIHRRVVERRVDPERRGSPAARHSVDLEGDVGRPHEPVVVYVNVNPLLERDD